MTKNVGTEKVPAGASEQMEETTWQVAEMRAEMDAAGKERGARIWVVEREEWETLRRRKARK